MLVDEYTFEPYVGISLCHEMHVGVTNVLYCGINPFLSAKAVDVHADGPESGFQQSVAVAASCLNVIA